MEPCVELCSRYKAADEAFYKWLLEGQHQGSQYHYDLKQLTSILDARLSKQQLPPQSIIDTLVECIRIRTLVDDAWETYRPSATAARHRHYTKTERLWLSTIQQACPQSPSNQERTSAECLSPEDSDDVSSVSDEPLASQRFNDGIIDSRPEELSWTTICIGHILSYLGKAKDAAVDFRNGNINIAEMTMIFDHVYLDVSAIVRGVEFLEPSAVDIFFGLIRELPEEWAELPEKISSSPVSCFVCTVQIAKKAKRKAGMALPILVPQGQILSPENSRFERLILSIGRHLVRLSRGDRSTPKEKLLHRAVTLAYQLSYSIHETLAGVSNMARAVSCERTDEKPQEDEHLAKIYNGFNETHNWIATDYERLHPWLAGRLIITHLATREVQSRTFISSKFSKFKAFLTTINQVEFPGLSQIWQSLSTRSCLEKAYGTGWPKNAEDALVSIDEPLATYDNNATVVDWWLEAAAIEAIYPGPKGKAMLKRLESVILELKRTFRAPILRRRLHEYQDVQQEDDRSLRRALGSHGIHPKEYSYSERRIPCQHLTSSQLPDMFQTVLVMSTFETKMICSMGGDFTTKDSSLWIIRLPSTGEGSFANKQRQIISSFKHFGFSRFSAGRNHLRHVCSTQIPKDSTFFLSFTIDQNLLQSSRLIPDSFKTRRLPTYQPLMKFAFVFFLSSMPQHFECVDPELDKALSNCERKLIQVEIIERHWIRPYDQSSTCTEAGLYPVSEEFRRWMRSDTTTDIVMTSKASNGNFVSGTDVKALAVLQHCLINTLFKVWHLIRTSNMQKAVETIQELIQLGIAGDRILFAYLHAAAGQAQLFLNPLLARRDFENAQTLHPVEEHQILLEIARRVAAEEDLSDLGVDESTWPLLVELRERHFETSVH